MVTTLVRFYWTSNSNTNYVVIYNSIFNNFILKVYLICSISKPEQSMFTVSNQNSEKTCKALFRNTSKHPRMTFTVWLGWLLCFPVYSVYFEHALFCTVAEYPEVILRKRSVKSCSKNVYKIQRKTTWSTVSFK